MKINFYLVLRITLIVLIICTLSFTFYQSLLPKEESSEASEEVSDFLEPIIPSDTPAGEFVHTNNREIAHFVEFFVLGLFVTLYVVIFMPSIDAFPKARVRYIVYSLFLAPIVALLDETVQIFTGRGPEIVDVWLDTAGFFSAAIIVVLIFLAVKYIRCRKKAAGEDDLAQ